MNRDDLSMTLRDGLLSAWRRYAGRPMIEVADRCLTYSQMEDVAQRWALHLSASAPAPFVAVFGHRSVSVYQSIMAVVIAGKAYLPLNPQFPAARLARMLDSAAAREMFVCPECAGPLEELLPLVSADLTLFCVAQTEALSRLASSFPQHRWVWLDRASPPASADVTERAPTPGDPAYLLFTSGSTGDPKGVVVTQRNVCSYVQTIIRKYAVRVDDRFSQMFDLTFDLSVHDMFVPWLSGACLCVVPPRSVMAPAAFIRKRELTMWFSVPSVAMFMNRMRMLKPGSFPTLRSSLFCGEALPATLADQWQQAAPNSHVDNLYGPTEATIAICDYRWDSQTSPQQCRQGLVPIGRPFAAQDVCVVDEHGNLVSGDAVGELCLSGDQVTPGYLNDPARTAERFVTLSHDDRIWYRTGDLAQQDEDGCTYFLGRVDSQVQILGHRVELAEIDSVLREAAETEAAVTVAWPLEQGRAEGVYGFLVGRHDTEAVLADCRRRLPDYMVPRRLICRPSFPTNSNGKIDRKQLIESLKELLHDAA